MNTIANAPLSCLCAKAFVVKMRSIKFDEWTFEQKSTFFLAIGLLLYNGTTH
jgi:hypothetical protein